ncbi:MAG: hypoxanthine phosphoribosyltransferase [Acidobacteriota bacterium]|nr:hypoxanthine phosphoribosyltransferase [Acidobacteriota bacterium]
MESQKDSHRIRVLLDEETIARRVLELARQIDADFAGSEDLVAIGVLKGSVFFFTDLVKRLKTPLRIDFFQTTSYGTGTTAGEVRIKRDIDLSIRGKDVILVEDIVDTGWTLRTILDLFRFRGARTVKLCALLDKHESREVEVPIDYAGFRIGREFVVGYGLDFNERYRNLPYIGVVEMSEK